MDGATSRSCVLVCECAHVHFYKIPTIWTIYDKNTNAFFKERLFDMPKNAPNSREKQHCKKNFVV